MIETKGIRSDWPGNAIHFWTQTKPEILTGFNQVSNAQAQKGDIVVLWGVNGNTYGHIGIASGGLTPTLVEILEQNGQTGNGTGTGGDAIRLRFVARSRIAGMLRPTPSAPVPSPAPAAPPHTITETYPLGKQITLTKQPTYKWGMNYTSFDFMAKNPVETHGAGEIKTVYDKVHHNYTGYDYYRESGQVDGYNTLDCADYTPPPPPPYIPPAPPVQVKPAETVNFMVSMMCYPSLTDARMKWNMHLEVNIEPNTTYYVHEKVEKFYKISDKNMTDRDWWVNLDDNKLPIIIPLPEPPVIEIITKPVEVLPEVPEVKWFWYNEDQQPTVFRYKGFKSAVISNLENHSETLNLPPNAQGPISRYAMINGNTYLIPDSEFKRGKLYGIYKDLMEEVEDRPIRQALDTNDDGKINVYDLAFIMTPAKDLYTKALPVIVKSQVFIKNNSKQVLDGFSARRKK